MRSRRPKLATLFSAVLALALPLAAAALQMSEDSTYTHALSAGGRVSLDNVNGDVTIEGWDQDEVRIEAVKRGRSQEALDAVEIEIDARGDSIHVETHYNDRGRRGRDSASVDYTVYVPRWAELDEIELVNGSLTIEGVAGDVTASTVNGRVRASGLSGDAEISTVNGRLEIAFSELEAGRSIELSSVNGPLELALPGHADIDVEASTVHGRIRNDFGLEVDHGEFVGHKLRGSVGGGGARIQLSNVNGSIDIRQAN